METAEACGFRRFSLFFKITIYKRRETGHNGFINGGHHVRRPSLSDHFLGLVPQAGW